MALKYKIEHDNAADQHNEYKKFSDYCTIATSFSNSHLSCLHLILTTSTLLVSATHYYVFEHKCKKTFWKLKA